MANSGPGAGCARPTILFDFDGVLVRGDSAARFLRERIGASWRRRLLALLVAPVALPLLRTRRGLPYAARLFGAISRLGDRDGAFEAHARDFAGRLAADDSRHIADGLDALRHAVAGGARVAIVSGSLDVVVAALLDAKGIRDVTIVASRTGPRRRHCYGARKIAALAEAGIAPPWQVAYSDSLADLPMLGHAERPVLINADARVARRAAAMLGRDAELMCWR